MQKDLSKFATRKTNSKLLLCCLICSIFVIYAQGNALSAACFRCVFDIRVKKCCSDVTKSRNLRHIFRNLIINIKKTTTMKKLLIAFALVLVCLTGNAQTIDKLFETFKGKPGADYVPLSKELIQMAMGMATKDSDDKEETDKMLEILKQIDSLNVLDIEETSDDVKKEFIDMAGKLEMKDYEQVANINDDDEQVLIYGIMVLDPKEPTLIQIKGNIDPENIGTIFQMNKN